MDTESLRHALTTHEFLSSVIEDERQAEMLGVGGVPAFIASRKAALTGVQPVENLRQLVNRVRSLER
jgi:predicted DsbA family dithiol-disulfide isomerase